MSNEYDISRAFKRIENDLMDSMMRNLKRHQAEENELGINWEQWQALQLKELERYRAENITKFGGDFTDINARIEDLFQQTYADAQAQEEARILDDIRKGKYEAEKKDVSYFNVNDAKLNTLLERTKADFTRAEYAVLRGATDQYRSIIFDAQVYANITNDYKKAVDMATHDYLKNGLQTIQYKGWYDKKGKYHAGAVHNISDYAEMAIRTGNKRAYLMGEGNAHDEFGIHTVRVNKRTQACPKCVGFLGKVLVDDVYAGGTPKEAMQKGVPLLSQAIAQGFLHPNCKDIYSMYIEGVSRPAEPWTQDEINEIVGDYNAEQELEHAKDMEESYARMAKYSLDPSNQEKYQARADGWAQRVADISAGMPPKPIVPPVIPKPVTPTPSAPTPQPVQPTPQPVQPVSGFVSQIDFADGIKQEELIKRLDGEYINHTTRVVHGAHKAGGTADLGGAIHLSNQNEATALHEFAHQIASEYRTKVGLGREQDAEFWKELKKIHRKYLKETEGNPSLWISSYEHGTRDVSEFMAEAFTQQKMKEYGLPLPTHYGTDDTYSKQVLELIDKYYKRETVAETVAEQVVDTFDRNNVVWSTAGKSYRDTLDNWGVAYNKTELLKNPLTEEEIIAKVGGGDQTKGSCVSVALSYIGNKCGINTLDFRGGDSRHLFSARGWNAVTKLNGITSVREATDRIRPCKAVLSQMVEGKEYLFSGGRHTSIVRTRNGVWEYLELQSTDRNGWHPFEEDMTLFKGTPYETTKHYTVTDRLKSRFGVTSSGATADAVLVDIEEYKNNDEFRDLLGYINTEASKQQKGKKGGIK